eukprot:Phypoly_transcript_09447.p1 GENE.Phypoly_transcript_09447~~Phypoly_transcript_09447.p1  ORF type:complete len:292 (+),score=61.26 Phypoly_transcript_09447:366-1241(+)
MDTNSTIAVLGCGNIGLSIAKGIVYAKIAPAGQVVVTKRNESSLAHLKELGYTVLSDNAQAVKLSHVIIVAVTPAQLNDILDIIKDTIDPSKHILISVVSGASISAIKARIGKPVPVVRAMPNTAIAFCESMTCIAADVADEPALKIAEHIFEGMGACVKVKEDQIVPATALCACGVAFFCRAIRAAAQGGVEIGFHAEDAIKMAAQTAKGAATLLLKNKNHPEFEVDKVTTPMGCTIAGLNKMEHHGFSSAMIRGITTSAEKAASLYSNKPKEGETDAGTQKQRNKGKSE